MTALLISDLHLQPERPDIAAAFEDFLQSKAAGASALYILGDLFESWVGDDDDDPFVLRMIGALRQTADRGTQLFFMHGNRDFLIGQGFAEVTGVTLLPDPYRTCIEGHDLVLLHGDSLCTADSDYMAFREVVRDPTWQAGALAKPLGERRTIASQLREASQANNQNKPEAIMDVTPEEVERVLTDQRVRLMVHGHTHRPAVHPLDVQGHPSTRIVLGDWDARGWYLRIDASGHALLNFPIAQ